MGCCVDNTFKSISTRLMEEIVPWRNRGGIVRKGIAQGAFLAILVHAVIENAAYSFWSPPFFNKKIMELQRSASGAFNWSFFSITLNHNLDKLATTEKEYAKQISLKVSAMRLGDVQRKERDGCAKAVYLLQKELWKFTQGSKKECILVADSQVVTVLHSLRSIQLNKCSIQSLSKRFSCYTTSSITVRAEVAFAAKLREAISIEKVRDFLVGNCE